MSAPPPSPPGGATGGPPGASSPAQATSQSAKALADWQDQMTAAYYAASILALLAIFTISHLIDRFIQSHQSKNTSKLTKLFVNISRTTRSILLHKISGFPSIGHALVFSTYIGINIILSFYSLHGNLPHNLAKRMGWITACNLTLAVFLALKNTPLAFLTAYSYERLRILHQLAGYTTIFCMALHATTYLVTISQLNLLTPIMTQLSQIMGAVVGISMLLMILSFFLLRKRSYELFYATHMILFLLIIIGLGFHRPDISAKAIYIFFFSAGIFFLDRAFRFLKLAFYFPGNKATVVALEHGGVRIVMKRTPWRTDPGSHVFLWIPRISLEQTHPFTVVSTNPLELVVKAHDGFTKYLLAYASTKSDSGELWASADGPYGTLPSFEKFDHVVLIAGGSGATFTFGIAAQLLKRVEKAGARKTIVHFIWVIRETEMQTWFSKELAALSSSPLFLLIIHVTGSPSSTRPVSPLPLPAQLSDDEKPSGATTTNSSVPNSTFDHDPEKGGSKEQGTSIHSGSVGGASNVSLIMGRPDLTSKITEVVESTGEEEKTIVAACGPDGMMREVRRTVAAVVGRGERSVELHLEAFGW